ncbi:hypothetical protein [Diaphorobacter sp.]|uniref:hypothetical protein n=1 Tax=Diaphorobacter sp. TaxID=1934310 RepID=UPI003D0A58B5
MRDEEAKRAPVNLDWGASTWSLTEVFDAFLRPDLKGEGRLRNIVNALNEDDLPEEVPSSVVDAHKKLRVLIKDAEIKVLKDTQLHPAVWLRLLHFIGESTGLYFETMEESYCEWRKSNGSGLPIVRRQNPETHKARSFTIDVFLLLNIDGLQLEKPYKWGRDTMAALELKRSEKTIKSKQPKRGKKTSLESRIEKIGKNVCRNVEDMLDKLHQNISNLLPIRTSGRNNIAQGETRRYQYQGAALTLAQELKNQRNSPLSQRSDEVVAKAVRVYVKCS